MMKRFTYLFVLLVLLTDSSLGQWVQTNGPYGGTVTSLAISGPNIFAGTYDAGVFLSTNNGTSWTAVNTGLTNTDIQALAVSGSNLFAGGGGGVFLSTNDGSSWTAVNTGMTNIFVGSLAVSGTNLFAGTGENGVFLSTNDGTSWTAVKAGLTSTFVRVLAVSGTNIFAGTYGVGVFLSTNDGTSWTEVNTGLTNTEIQALAVSGANLLAGTHSGVFLSTNDGTSWTAVNAGMTNTFVGSLAVNGTNLFAGTWYGGVFLSTDNGTSWTAVNTGLPNRIVQTLAVSGTNLFAGTSGGGVWKRPLTEMVGNISLNYEVQANWNLISVPLSTDDYAKSSLFPTSTSNAFYYDAGYFSSSTLENGKGYWLKFPSAQTISLSGIERTIDTIDVAAGWNMIGTLSLPVPTSNIGSIPGGIVTSSFYDFTSMYEADITLEAGKGYWVKVSAPGQLIMSASGSIQPQNRIRIIDTGERHPILNPPE